MAIHGHVIGAVLVADAVMEAHFCQPPGIGPLRRILDDSHTLAIGASEHPIGVAKRRPPTFPGIPINKGDDIFGYICFALTRFVEIDGISGKGRIQDQVAISIASAALKISLKEFIALIIRCVSKPLEIRCFRIKEIAVP